MASLSSGRIGAALVQAGLSNFVSLFSNISEQAFCALTLADLGRLGVEASSDRQALHRVAAQLKASAPSPPPQRRGSKPQPAAAIEVQAELIDLDNHDADLLAHACGPALQLSPMGNDRNSRGGAAAAPPPQQAPQQPQLAAPAAQQQQQQGGRLALPDESADPPKIRVVVRKRPINRKEKERGEEDIVDCFMERSCIVVNETKLKVDLTKYLERHQFNFDEALDEGVSNDEVYNTTVQPLVQTLFRNGRASCFAYGQTGSGKTHTMSPLPIRAAADILRYLSLEQYLDVTLWVSCFEIYGNKVFDLLNQRKRLNILEDGKKQVVVVGLREMSVGSTDTVKQLIEEANRQRSVGSTAANADSSRSHSIMQFALKRGADSTGDGKLVGKISFIDLAGSERGADTYDNNRQTRLEGAEINKSLLALKECIRALDSDAKHVPFRGSKLTAVLRDSFLGDQARTVMIANISPNSASVEHTLNTLRYADRVKELRKDKAERAPGGVTPGEDPAYYAAVARAQQQPSAGAGAARDKSPLRGAGGGGGRPRTPSRDLQPAAREHGGPSRGGAPDYGNGGGGGADEEDELVKQRDDLMDTILEEEEQLINAHRVQIEETMDAVRKEMALLTEVDQPGSAIDVYVERLDELLQGKLALIQGLRHKLDRFKEHLKLEESLSKSIPPGSHVKKYYS